MPHVHSYDSGFLFLPSILVLTSAIDSFSFCYVGSSYLMAPWLSLISLEGSDRLQHTEKQTT